eukprot:scaffold61734_cov63-Phaeocystis_antarctica.AAC.5
MDGAPEQRRGPEARRVRAHQPRRRPWIDRSIRLGWSTAGVTVTVTRQAPAPPPGERGAGDEAASSLHRRWQGRAPQLAAVTSEPSPPALATRARWP